MTFSEVNQHLMSRVLDIHGRATATLNRAVQPTSNLLKDEYDTETTTTFSQRSGPLSPTSHLNSTVGSQSTDDAASYSKLETEDEVSVPPVALSDALDPLASSTDSRLKIHEHVEEGERIQDQFDGSSDSSSARFTLIVNVPPLTTRSDLVLAFKRFGHVELAMVVCDKRTRHQNKEWTATAGYSFVRFASSVDAEAALAAVCAGTVRVRGCRVRATWAKKDSYYAKQAAISEDRPLESSPILHRHEIQQVHLAENHESNAARLLDPQHSTNKSFFVSNIPNPSTFLMARPSGSCSLIANGVLANGVQDIPGYPLSNPFFIGSVSGPSYGRPIQGMSNSSVELPHHGLDPLPSPTAMHTTAETPQSQMMTQTSDNSFQLHVDEQLLLRNSCSFRDGWESPSPTEILCVLDTKPRPPSKRTMNHSTNQQCRQPLFGWQSAPPPPLVPEETCSTLSLAEQIGSPVSEDDIRGSTSAMAEMMKLMKFCQLMAEAVGCQLCKVINNSVNVAPCGHLFCSQCLATSPPAPLVCQSCCTSIHRQTLMPLVKEQTGAAAALSGIVTLVRALYEQNPVGQTIPDPLFSSDEVLSLIQQGHSPQLEPSEIKWNNTEANGNQPASGGSTGRDRFVLLQSRSRWGNNGLDDELMKLLLGTDEVVIGN